MLKQKQHDFHVVALLKMNVLLVFPSLKIQLREVENTTRKRENVDRYK